MSKWEFKYIDLHVGDERGRVHKEEHFHLNMDDRMDEI